MTVMAVRMMMMSLLVFPEELELGHREKVGAGPDLDEEELSEWENSPSLPAGGGLLAGCLRGGRGRGRTHVVLDSFVESVGGVMAAVWPHPLK